MQSCVDYIELDEPVLSAGIRGADERSLSLYRSHNGGMRIAQPYAYDDAVVCIAYYVHKNQQFYAIWYKNTSDHYWVSVCGPVGYIALGRPAHSREQPSLFQYTISREQKCCLFY